MGPDGTLYVVDDAGTGIFAVAPDGRRRQVEIQGLPKTHYERMRQLDFTLLQEVTVDPRDGSIYVSQQGGLVRKISRGGVMTRVAGTGSQDGARGNGIPAVSAVIAVDSLAVDPATGTLYRAGSKAGSDLWRRMA
jgi:hypothetical protein